MFATSRVLLIFGALIATGVRAQDASLDPIDVQFNKCLQDTTGETTAGMRQCVHLAYQAWDAELNKTYKDLLEELSSEGKEVLRKTQQAWLIYRDAQIELNSRIYFEELRGSLYTVTAGASNTELVKQRVLELRTKLADLREGK